MSIHVGVVNQQVHLQEAGTDLLGDALHGCLRRQVQADDFRAGPDLAGGRTGLVQVPAGKDDGGPVRREDACGLEAQPRVRAGDNRPCGRTGQGMSFSVHFRWLISASHPCKRM